MLQRSIICINSIIVRGNGNKNVEQTIFFLHHDRFLYHIFSIQTQKYSIFDEVEKFRKFNYRVYNVDLNKH